MRYFRRNAVGWPGCEVGIIKSENEFPRTNGKAFNGNEYWEEVIVTPKPQPKKHKIKLALFRWPSSESLFELTEQRYKVHYERKNLIQVTDWVEVDFVEKV